MFSNKTEICLKKQIMKYFKEFFNLLNQPIIVNDNEAKIDTVYSIHIQ